ncbi:acyltransferase/acetyltransferase [Bacteroidia bacterium]|nr:acyltransferase/acetyltransferase [Bacteroidia bacterium]
MSAQRNILYDIAKGLGILLVIWGHTDKCSAFDLIYAFHMPFFFIVSGVFFRQQDRFGELCNANLKRLIYPYLLFSVLIYLFYLTWGFVFKNPCDYKIIFKIIPWKGVISSPLWFLITLFIVSTLFYFFSKIKNPYVLITLTLSLFFIARYWPVLNYFYLNEALQYFVYYALGYLFLSKYENKYLSRFSKIQKTGLFIISLVGFYGLFLIRNAIDFKIITILFSFLIAVFGSWMLIHLAACLEKIKYLNRILAYIGRNSLTIFAIQLPMMEVSRPLSDLFFERYTQEWVGIHVLINLGLAIVAAEVFYRIFPKILHKNK